MITDLVSKNITPVQLFSENGLDPVLDKIRQEIDLFVPNIETKKGRKEIGSFAYKIAQSKTFIDKAGKELNADIKAKAKLIDAERKRSRDTLDDWKNEVRQPLTDFEEAEEKRIEAERLLEISNMDHEEALGMNDFFNREKALAVKEAEIARQEEEKRQKEEAAEKKAANKKHQASVNNKILDAFSVLDIPKETAKKIVVAVCKGEIPNMIIQY